MLPAKRAQPIVPSRLNQMAILEDVSDTESVAESVVLNTSQTETDQPELDEGGRKFWTNAEEIARKGLPHPWREMINSNCHRRPFLSYLGEGKVVPPPEPTPRDVCCSGCNPSIFPRLTDPPVEDKGTRALSAATRAGIAISFV